MNIYVTCTYLYYLFSITHHPHTGSTPTEHSLHVVLSPQCSGFTSNNWNIFESIISKWIDIKQYLIIGVVWG